jgi:hypothetical protein
MTIENVEEAVIPTVRLMGVEVERCRRLLVPHDGLHIV